MFSLPPNGSAVSAWFQRLEAAWRRMPEEERTRQREEVEQHLEALVAAKAAQGQPVDAAWSAALEQFGDPTQIGHKVYREWYQGRIGFRPDVTAISFGIGLLVLKYYIFMLLWPLWFDRVDPHSIGTTIAIAWSSLIMIGIVIGLKYPQQAIKSSFYSQLLVYVYFWTFLISSIYLKSHGSITISSQLVWVVSHDFLRSMLFLGCYIVGAYLASVTKRGWYRPTLDDFKIALPKRPRQISH